MRGWRRWRRRRPSGAEWTWRKGGVESVCQEGSKPERKTCPCFASCCCCCSAAESWTFSGLESETTWRSWTEARSSCRNRGCPYSSGTPWSRRPEESVHGSPEVWCCLVVDSSCWGCHRSPHLGHRGPGTWLGDAASCPSPQPLVARGSMP